MTAPMAQSQSMMPIPSGASTLARGGSALLFRFQEKTRKIRPSTQAMWMPRCMVSGSRPKPAV